MLRQDRYGDASQVEAFDDDDDDDLRIGDDVGAERVVDCEELERHIE